MIYDAIVVGGGPAGAIFASYARNMKILLIDGQNPENSKPCGGLLSPDAQLILAKFNLTLPKEVLTDPQIFSVKTVDLVSKKIRFYRRSYLNMDRYKFDSFLLSLAKDNAEIISGRVISIVKNGEIFSVKVRNSTGISEFSAKNIVGADGANSIVRKTFYEDSTKYYVAVQQWFYNKRKVKPSYFCIYDRETSKSCSWLLHKDEFIIFGGAFSPKFCRKNFERQKEKLCKFLGYDFGEIYKTEACKTYSPRKLSDFITGENNVYLIGEAAGFISASSFEGISSAILSGKNLADAFLSGGESAKTVARNYRKSTLKLRMKLLGKVFKMRVLNSYFLRNAILKIGIESIKVEE